MTESIPAIYGFSAHLLDGRAVRLEDYRGQVLLIVNTASRCGFTPQYQGLQTLYDTYRSRGFAVLAFPCNQFSGQEPGTAEQIRSFCESNYRVTFPVFAKIDVNGPGTDPLYRFLKRQSPGTLGFLTRGRIPWNFTKFLCSRAGNVERRFAPATRPQSLAPIIETLLNRE